MRFVSLFLTLLFIVGCKEEESRIQAVSNEPEFVISESKLDDIRPLIASAERGDPLAQYDLGTKYKFGSGVPKDYAEAVKWFRKAAEQGHAKAQFSLGVAYYEGQGVPKDEAAAVRSYLKAAEQGHAVSQYMIGLAYENGKFVLKDHEVAARWYRKAAAQHVAPAQYNLGAMYAEGRGVNKDFEEAYVWWDVAARGATGSKKAKEALALLTKRMTTVQITRAHARSTKLIAQEEAHWRKFEEELHER